jgi:hypothetical protein
MDYWSPPPLYNHIARVREEVWVRAGAGGCGFVCMRGRPLMIRYRVYDFCGIEGCRGDLLWKSGSGSLRQKAKLGREEGRVWIMVSLSGLLMCLSDIACPLQVAWLNTF